MAKVTTDTDLKLISNLTPIETPTSTDVLLIQRNLKSYQIKYNNLIKNLPDDITIEESSNKLQLKDGGITGAKIATNTITADKLNTGPLAGFRNAIINGNFDIWQRGVSGSGNTYVSDRWFNAAVGTTNSISRQSFTLGQTDVPNNPLYYQRTTVTSVAGSSNFANLNQKIEGVRTFAGQTVTLSFWAKADSTKNIAIDFLQYFGSGGSPSSTVSGIGQQKFTLTTSWQKFTATVDIPSILGKTLGTNTDNFLLTRFWFDAGSDWDGRTDSLGQQSGTFDIAQVQVEPCEYATPFETRPIGTEIQLCERYCQKSYNLETVPGTITWVGAVTLETRDTDTFWLTNTQLRTRMRGTPAMQYWVVSGAGTVSSILSSETNLAWYINVSGAIETRWQYLADAEL